MQPATGNFYRYIPHPDVFESLGAKFYRLTVAEMIEDLHDLCGEPTHRRCRCALHEKKRLVRFHFAIYPSLSIGHFLSLQAKQ